MMMAGSWKVALVLKATYASFGMTSVPSLLSGKSDLVDWSTTNPQVFHGLESSSNAHKTSKRSVAVNSPRGVLAEACARHEKSNGLVKTDIYHWKRCLPRFGGQLDHAIFQWLVPMLRMLICNRVYLFEDTTHPLGVGCQVHKHPGGVDPGIQLSCEKESQYELGISVEAKIVLFEKTHRGYHSQAVVLIDEMLQSIVFSSILTLAIIQNLFDNQVKPTTIPCPHDFALRWHPRVHDAHRSRCDFEAFEELEDSGE